MPDGAALLRAQIQDLTAQAAPRAMPGDAPGLLEASAATTRAQHDHAVTLDGDSEQENDAEESDSDALEDEDDEDEDDEQDDLEQIAEPPERIDGDAGHNRAAPATPPSDSLPMMSPQMLTQFQAIQAALTLAERMQVAELVARLSPAELRRWITELTGLPVPAALAKIRAALAATGPAGLGPKGGVS